MKRWILFLLCLSMLLLPACQKKKASIDLPTGSDGDYQEWNRFIWECKLLTESTFVMLRAKESGGQERVTVTYDGETYTITDDAGTRTYPYLICDTYAQKTDKGYTYGDCFFLTDDPNMDYSRYYHAKTSPLNAHMQLLLPTELVLAKTGVADLAQSFGKMPKETQSVLTRLADKDAQIVSSYFCRDSFFLVDAPMPHYMDFDSETDAHFHLKRYDYQGNLLSSVEIPHMWISTIAELDDGSYCACIKMQDYEGSAQLLCVSAAGEIRWQHTFPAGNDVHIQQMIQTADAVYALGTNAVATDHLWIPDLYIAKFSTTGEVISEMTPGGSGMENFYGAEIYGSNITLFCSTASSDGDFPLAKEGQQVFFRVTLHTDMTLSETKTMQSNPISYTRYGFFGDEVIYEGDPILAVKEADRLPEKAFVVGVYSANDGYVILRRLRLETCIFTNPTLSSTKSYYQLIATYYNENGEVIGQTVSEPYLG